MVNMLSISQSLHTRKECMNIGMPVRLLVCLFWVLY
nr:Uncharacterised protein [Raoultella sp. NCTC 9187]